MTIKLWQLVAALVLLVAGAAASAAYLLGQGHASATKTAAHVPGAGSSSENSVDVELNDGPPDGSPGTPLVVGVIAEVGDERITRKQVDQLLGQARRSFKAQKRPFPKAGTPEYQQLVTQAVQFLVQRVQFSQKAAERNIKVTDAEVVKRLKQIKKQYFGASEKRYKTALKQQGLTDEQVSEDVKAQLTSERLFKDVTKDVKVGDKEVREYYNKNPQLYSQLETRDVRHILVKGEGLADSIYWELCGSASPCLEANADFAALAKKHSTDPGTKSQGGKLTVVKGQTVPEFDQVAFSLRTNEISLPTHTQYGFHVIQALSAIRPKKSFAQVKESIKQQLVSRKQSEGQRNFLDAVKTEYTDKIRYAPGFAPPNSTGKAKPAPDPTATPAAPSAPRPTPPAPASSGPAAATPTARPTPATAAVGTEWTEFGATKEAWYSAHVPDPNPKLTKGCCFLPGLPSGYDRYYLVTYDNFSGVSRVDSFWMHFEPKISVASAQAVVRAAAPPQSSLVFSVIKRDCLQVEYKSTALSQAFRSKDAAMFASLYSSENGRFDGRTVQEIAFLTLPLGDRSIDC